MMSHEILIRRAESVADYRACQDAQRRAWGITEESYVVPVATMAGAQHHGGVVLGAFQRDGTAVGMSFGFLGRTDGRICLYSQLTGVVPDYQDQGIGGRLKAAQRAIAREEGIACIAWAFDPLQAGNARFNLEKLGARVVRYLENMYGFRTDALNRDTPTDRLIAVWETADDPGMRRQGTDAIENTPRLIVGGEGPTFAGLADAPRVLLEIPLEITALRQVSPAIAARWSLAVRQAFQSAFSAGYLGVGFHHHEGRGFYVLECPCFDSGVE